MQDDDAAADGGGGHAGVGIGGNLAGSEMSELSPSRLTKLAPKPFKVSGVSGAGRSPGGGLRGPLSPGLSPGGAGRPPQPQPELEPGPEPEPEP